MLLFALSTGCSRLTFVADPPARASHESSGGEVSGEVTRVEIDVVGTDHYSLHLDAPAGTHLSIARIASGYAPAYTFGDAASLVHVDGQARWDMSPIPIAGSHDVELEFGYSKTRSASGPVAIDLELERGQETTCLRLPVRADPGKGSHWRLANTGAFGLGPDVNVPLHHIAGIDAIVAFPLELGGWVGPLRLAAQPGLFAIAACNPSVCGTDSRGRGKAGFSLPFGAGATYYFPSSGLFASGIELRVRENLAWIPADTGTERVWIHSPQVVFHAGITAPDIEGGLPGGPRIVSMDFEALAGMWLLRERDEFVATPMLGGGLVLRTWL